MRVTQKDIARRMGVSPSLVSRALTGTAPGIGADPATVRRIRARARDMGYVPSAPARQLRGRGAPVIGLTVADLQDPFFGPAVAEVIGQCHKAGYALALAGFERRCPGAPDVDLLLQQDLLALLVLGSGPLEWARPFVERGCRVIRIGSGPAIEGVDQVSNDESWGMKLVVEHLARLGHRHFAFIGARLSIHEERLRWARRHLKSFGLQLSPGATVLAGAEVLEAGMAGVEQLARQCGGEWPSAMICSSDAVALGALRGVALQGLRVPDHVSLTGFDDLALAALAAPPLTSVRQPLGEMVRDALRRIAESRGPDAVSAHKPSLIVRASTAAAWHA